MWTEIEPGGFIPSPEKNKTTLPIYLTSQISSTSCLKNQTKRDFLSFFFYHRSRIEQTILDENFPTFYTPTLKNRRPNPQSRRPIDPPRSSKTNKKKKKNKRRNKKRREYRRSKNRQEGGSRGSPRACFHRAVISWHRTQARTINLGQSLFIGLVPLCLVAKPALVGVPSVKRLRAPRPRKPSTTTTTTTIPPLSATPVIPHYRFARWWKPNDPRARVYRPPFFHSEPASKCIGAHFHPPFLLSILPVPIFYERK